MPRVANIPPGSPLDTAAEALLKAAAAYWQEFNRQGAHPKAAVVWLQDSDGQLVVMTRGEYTETLLECVEDLH